MNREQPQPKGRGVLVADRLIELIRERTQVGVKKYGEPLTTHNGRDVMIDALQESVDLNQYLMQIIMELEDDINHLSYGQIKPLADYLSTVGGTDRDETPCEMAVRLLKDMQGVSDNTIRSLCGYVCPNHERTAVVYCNKLQHYDVDSPHICENGHLWPTPINADPSG